MGVFTVTKQVTMGLNLRTSWWLSGAALDLDFRNSRYYDSSLGTGVQSLASLSNYISCSRASTGYAKNSAGNLVSFGNNALRKTDLGLLIEEARTNVQIWSQDFTNLGWSKNQTSVGTTTTAPDGTSTAQNLVEDTSNNSHNVSISAGLSANPFTWSIYAKAAGRNFVYLQACADASNRQIIIVDLTSGAITTSHMLGTVSGVSTAVEVLGNGWCRLQITATATASAFFVFGLSNSGTPTLGANDYPAYLGDGSSGAYFWGAQLEQGTFATSYVPTTSASATRAVDAVSLSGALASLLNGTAASVLMDYLATSPFVGWDDLNSISSACTIFFISGDTRAGNSGVDGTHYTDFSSTGVKFSTGAKLATSWDASTGSSIVAGLVSVSPGSASHAMNHSDYTLSDSNFPPGSSYRRRLTVWNSKLNDAVLRPMTYAPGMTDTTAWVNSVVLNGGTVSSTRQGLVDALINGLKTDGVWSKLDALWLFAAENTASALFDLVCGRGASQVNSPTFTVDRGYTGNGTSSYINTNFNPSAGTWNYSQNSAHFGVYVRVTDVTTGHSPIGMRDASQFSQITNAGASLYNWFVNDATGVTQIPIVAGMQIFTRTSSSSRTAYSNGSSQATDSVSSTAVPNAAFSVGARNNNGTVDSFSTAQIAAAVMGGALTATDVANLSSRINTYMTAIGANVY